jgi:hypothetical protein
VWTSIAIGFLFPIAILFGGLASQLNADWPNQINVFIVIFAIVHFLKFILIGIVLWTIIGSKLTRVFRKTAWTQTASSEVIKETTDLEQQESAEEIGKSDHVKSGEATK